jgi:lipopolysaccharide export system permease protein
MKILDRYILKHFIQNFLFGLLCFVILFILVDLFENLDKFIDKNIGLASVVQYYIYFIPDIIKLISPVGMLLASLFTISRFINYSELTAMKSAGIGILRYLVPIMAFGIFVTGFSIYFDGWIVPKTNRLKYNFERNYLGKNSIPNIIQNIYLEDMYNRNIVINSYDKQMEKCTNVSIQIFRKDTITMLEKRFDIREMNWDSTKKDWKLIEVYKRTFSGLDKETLNYYPMVYISELDDIKKINIDPTQILNKQLKPEELVLSEFSDFIDNLESSGQEVSKEKVDYYSIISFPFANLVTIIFGVAVSSNRRKGGAAFQFGIAIIVSFLYLGFVQISQVFGDNGDLNPIFTAWLANIIFFVISVINFFRINRT